MNAHSWLEIIDSMMRLFSSQISGSVDRGDVFVVANSGKLVESILESEMVPRKQAI